MVTARERLGDYELLCELGSGGMASLYVARQAGAANVERLVAVKRVHHHVLAMPGIQTMFRDEARLAALVRHPNVARVLDVIDRDGELLIVLDYIESVPLSALLGAARTTGERLPIPIIVRVLADALAGLHAAHEATDLHGTPLDIVHRDFSPQNVLVGTDGNSQLIDFGVAKAAARATATESGVLKGKFQYMSPEQARGGADLDRRSDVFAAGVVLFEALTGASPFGDDVVDPSAILLRIVLDPIPPASSLASGISPELDAVVERALERVRDERYQTAAQMRDALVAAVPPAGDAEVRAAVERLCASSIAARRAMIQRALVATDPTAIIGPGRAPTAGDTPPESTGPATKLDRPSVAQPTPAPTTLETAGPSGRRRAAWIAGGGVAAAAILSAGLVAGQRWRRGAEPASIRDAAPAAVVAPTAPAAVVAASAPAQPDAGTAPAATASAAPDAAAPARVAAATPPQAHASAARHAAPQPVHAPPAAPASPAASHATIVSASGYPIGTITPDGVLQVRGHEVRVSVRLVRNTTGIPDAAYDAAVPNAHHFLLVTYRNLMLALPGNQALPAGTITATYHLLNNAFVPRMQIASTFTDARLSTQLEYDLRAVLGAGMHTSHTLVTGDVVLALGVSVR